MNHYSTRRADMDKENRTTAKFREPTVRITRARAKASGPSGCLPPQKPLTNAKRAASDENQSATGVAASLQQKKRAVLKDATNILCDTANVKCMPGKQAKRFVVKKNAKVVSAVLMGPQVQEDTKGNNTEDTAKEREHESQEITGRVNSHTSIQECGVADLMLVKQTSRMHAKLQGPSQTIGGEHCKKLEVSDGVAVADIDSDRKDPQICSLYAPDIYRHLRATEFDRRPSVNYMEILQRDITHSMRAILIDWLVEVSEEYRLVPDTLYMTVNLIDRFLSVNYIEKQRLQLLGITCMLIASKYEEICAPRVEEFCFITDNTYTREEVLKMESQVLNFLGFHFSVPTPKKFLGRFIQAAQSSSKVPSKELAFLAQYLAELTLTEYGFLKFLPSLVAASAVFLAIWTLDQSDCPWNPTLEHYTSYKASELKPTVLELHELRLNTNESSLNAIREKYSQEKFNYVATQSPRELVPSLF